MQTKDYAIISRHGLGHLVVQVFWKREAPPTEDEMPNHLKTFKPEDQLDTAIEWIRHWYMHAAVIETVS